MKSNFQSIYSHLGISRLAAVLGIASSLLLVTHSRATTLIWNGGGANGNWSSAANWFGAGTPTNGDTVVFQGAAGLNNTNNIANLTLSQIQFRNGGFVLYGNAFTLTNSILCTNTVGTNTVAANLTLATADVQLVVSNGTSVSLFMSNSISGSVGVVKSGTGNLYYRANIANGYTGTTLIRSGLFIFYSGAADAAFGGPLVIGDGSGTIAYAQMMLAGDNIPNTTPVTVNLGGTFDLNGFNETIGALTISGGTVTTGTGTLTLNGNLTTLASGTSATITGNLAFTGGLRTITVADGGAFYDLNCLANIKDNGNGLMFTNSPAGASWARLTGSNTISGPIIANNLTLDEETSYSLGATNPVTIGGNGTLWLFSSGFTNKTLTLQGGAILTSQNNNTWAGPIVLGGNVSINAFSTASTLNLAGGISGTGNIAVTADNSGWSLLLSGSTANTFNGDLSIQTGTLLLNNLSGFDGAIPHNLFIGDATHSATNRLLTFNQINNASTVTLYNGSLLDLNNNIEGIGSLVMYGGSVTMGIGLLDMYPPGTIITPSPTSGSLNISGILGLQTPCTFLITNGLTITAQIYGNGSLTKTSYGSLFLQGSNSYTGLTSVQQGWLYAQNSFALGNTNAGTVVSSGATLVLQGGLGITNESLTLNGLGNPGWMALDCESPETNSWAGPITLSADSNLGNFSSVGLLRLNGPINGAGGLIAGGQSGYGGTLSLEGTTPNTYAGLTTVSSGTTLALNKNAGINAVAGNLDIFGTLRLGNSRQTAPASDVTIEASGLFDCGVFFDYIDALSGVGSMTFGVGGWIELGYNNGSSTFNGVMSGTGYTSGGYSVAKRGSGAIALNGNNTFTAGAYHIFGGTLLVNGSSPQVPAIVDVGTTLGGSGTVGTIAANGTISPGNSPGILNSSNVTFTASGQLIAELTGPTAGTGYDQLSVTGTNTLANATLTVVPAFTTPATVGQQFTILNNDLADASTGTFNGLAEGATISAGGYKFTISYVGGTGNDVVLALTAIPAAVAGSAVTSGDGSHGLDPNGCNNLALVITNTSGLAMTGVNATLSTTTPGVLITQPYATYPNIPASGKGTNLAPFQISTLPGFVCGTTINLQLIVNSSLGSFTMNSTVTSGESAAPTRFDNNIVTNCPDIGSIDSTNLVASWTGGGITKVAVSLWLVAPFDSDMSLSLIAPDGTTVPLVAATGAGANFGSGSADGSRTTFDDSAATAITAGASPFVGTFRPQGSLASFNGIGTINGSWHLHVVDGFGSGSPDTLRAWSLFLSGTACATGSGACDYCLTAITGTMTNTDLIMTNRLLRNGVEASCGAPKAWPFAGDFAPHRYDVFTFTNTSAADACVTVLLNGTGDVQAGVYLNAFDPANQSTNYLADSGNSTAFGPQTCSAEIPAGAKFAVEVNEITTGTNSSYTLQLSGLPCPPPSLTIQPVTTNTARLSWPTYAGGYLLEATPSLTVTNWTSITNEPIVSALKYNVTNSTLTPTNRFYRLKKP